MGSSDSGGESQTEPQFKTRPVNAAMRFFRIPRNWDELRELLTPEELDEIRRECRLAHPVMTSPSDF